jgi:hypothetical protein
MSALAAIVALVAIGAVVWPSGEGDPSPGQRRGSGATPTSVAAPASAAPAAPAAGGSSAAAALGAVPAAPVPPPPEPRPVLADGRHAVYVTDVDVPGSTVEVDLLQYLATDEEREAYEHSHPDDEEHYEDGEEYEDYDEGPFRNDNPRLRRLPVMHDLAIVVRQTTEAEGCNGEYVLDFATLSENLRDRSYGIGHLGTNPFWLTVHDGIVVALDEVPCAG